MAPDQPEVDPSASTSSSRPTRRRRLRVIVHPPTDHEPFRLLDLPIELVEEIKSHLSSFKDVMSLASTSKALWEKWGKDWPLTVWSRDPNVTSTGGMFALSSSQPGDIGYFPFQVTRARADQLNRVEVEVVEVEPDELERHKNEAFLPLYDIRRLLRLQSSSSSIYPLRWSNIRHEMIRATPAWLGAKFPCPVCSGNHTIAAGSKLLHKRWPAMKDYDGDKRRQIDCPGCSGIDYAINYATETGFSDRDGEALLYYLDNYTLSESDDDDY